MENKIADKGILYITAAGDKYIAEARASAASARDQMPDIPRAIVTDHEAPGDVFDITISLSDPDYSWVDKSDNIHRTPFNRTLYLDTDTYIARPVNDIFEILDHCDIATALVQQHPKNSDLPASMPIRQAGVIAFESNPTTMRLFDKWRDIFSAARERGLEDDQLPLTRAIIESNATVQTLPVEDNCLIYYGERLEGPVRIVHGRPRERLPEIALLLNEKESNRIFIGDTEIIIDIDNFYSRNIGRKLFYLFKHRGSKEVLKYALRWFRSNG